MKIKFFGVGQEPCYKEIENSLEAMQELVGGYIEMIELENRNYLVCNEEGKIRNLPYNKYVTDEGTDGKTYIIGDIYGNYFIVGVNNDGECEDIHE